MKIKRKTRRLVRYWVPRFRIADGLTLRTYRNHAKDIYVSSEAYIIERVCGSEIKRRRAKPEEEA